jgi:hypothetical protein
VPLSSSVAGYAEFRALKDRLGVEPRQQLAAQTQFAILDSEITSTNFCEGWKRKEINFRPCLHLSREQQQRCKALEHDS